MHRGTRLHTRSSDRQKVLRNDKMKHLLFECVHVLWFKVIPVETYFPEVGLPMGVHAAQGGACVRALACPRLLKHCQFYECSFRPL